MENRFRNVLALAYVGDGVYELYVRRYLFFKGIEKVNDLQKEAVRYVSAKGQAQYVQTLLELNLLTEEEQDILLRARNHKSHTSPKNTDIITYKQATGLEAVIGYLYLEGKQDRLDEIMQFILKER